MDAKEIIKKHFTIVRTIAVFFVLLLYFVVFNTENELLMLLAVLTILFMHKLLVFLVSHKVILYVLFKRFDASTFNEVISDRRFKVSWFYRINGAISSGDYQTTINIAVRQIKKRNLSINKKCLYLSILARAYFELRDFDKLKVLVAKYEEYRSKCISKKAITPQFFWWDYYKCFLEGKYEECQNLSQKIISATKSKKWDFEFNKIQSEFYYAIACFEGGENKKAKECFEKIILLAPNLYFSDISKKYLDAINSKETPIISGTHFLPDSDFEVYAVGLERSHSKFPLIVAICAFIIALIISVFECI